MSWNVSNKEAMIERRRQKLSQAGLELCQCGGVIWNLGDCRKCGDCQRIIKQGA